MIELLDAQSPEAVIKVVGIGGCGGNAVDHMIKKGMTLDQIRAANPTKGYNARYGAETGTWTTRMFVDAVHASLTKGAGR